MRGFFLKEFDIEFFALGPRGGAGRREHGGEREREEERNREEERVARGQITEASREEERRGVWGSALSRSSARNPPSHSEFPCWRLRARDSRWGLPSGTAELRQRIITFYADFNTRLRPALPLSPGLARPARSRPGAPSRNFESSMPRYHPVARFRTAPNLPSSPFCVVLLFSCPAAPARTPITEIRFLRRSIERTNERSQLVGR